MIVLRQYKILVGIKNSIIAIEVLRKTNHDLDEIMIGCSAASCKRIEMKWGKFEAHTPSKHWESLLERCHPWPRHSEAGWLVSPPPPSLYLSSKLAPGTHPFTQSLLDEQGEHEESFAIVIPIIKYHTPCQRFLFSKKCPPVMVNLAHNQ